MAIGNPVPQPEQDGGYTIGLQRDFSTPERGASVNFSAYVGIALTSATEAEFDQAAQELMAIVNAAGDGWSANGGQKMIKTFSTITPAGPPA